MRFAAGVAFLAITAIAVAIGMSRNQAVRARDRAEASKLLALAELRLQEDPTEALALTIASLEEADTEEARVFAMKVLWEAPPALELDADSQAVRDPAFSPDGKWLATAGHTTDAFVWSEDGRGPIVLPGHETSPRGNNTAQWASNTLLVTGPCCMLATRAHYWSLPEGKPVRTVNFDRPSYWQVGPELLLAETLQTGSAEKRGVGLLRSWALPDGEPVVLGSVEWEKLRTSRTFFTPDGTSWLYARDRNVYSRPLPVGTGPDRLFARLGGEFANFWTTADRLVVADKSGETHVWSFPHDSPVQEGLIPKPDTASYGMLLDPSARWLRGVPSVDQEVRLWDLTAWKGARALALRRSASWYGSASRFHPAGDWVVASTANFTRLTFWPLEKTYAGVVDGYTSLFRPVGFSRDGNWLATSWGDGRLRLWPLRGSGIDEVRTLNLPETLEATALALDPKSRYLFAVGTADRAWVVPLNGSAPRKLSGFSEDTLAQASAISPSGRLVATAFSYGQAEKTLRVWDLETGELRRFDLPAAADGSEARTGYEQGINNLAFADDSTLFTMGDGGLRRWNLETGSNKVVSPTLLQYGMRGSFSGDGHTAITSEVRWGEWDDCRRALLHDLTTGTSRELMEFGECGSWRRQGALDQSGTVAATGSLNGIVRVGRLSGGEPHLLVGHRGVVDRIAISPDLRWVATTGEDNTLRLWPMPDLSKPPLHTLPHDKLLAKLRSLTNLRAVRDTPSATGWKVEVGPFPGWKHIPTW
jgi:WD40 repeat protein